VKELEMMADKIRVPEEGFAETLLGELDLLAGES
jgi:hypothetical protein